MSEFAGVERLLGGEPRDRAALEKLRALFTDYAERWKPMNEERRAEQERFVTRLEGIQDRARALLERLPSDNNELERIEELVNELDFRAGVVGGSDGVVQEIRDLKGHIEVANVTIFGRILDALKEARTSGRPRLRERAQVAARVLRIVEDEQVQQRDAVLHAFLSACGFSPLPKDLSDLKKEAEEINGGGN